MPLFSRKKETVPLRLLLLQEVPLFSTLTRKELGSIQQILHERNYLQDEVIFEEGDEGLGMYVVMSGSVRIWRKDEKGEPTTLARITRGGYFGDLALLDGAPRTATAVADEPSRLIGFFRPEFLNILETHGTLGLKLSFQLALLTGARLRESLAGTPAYASAS